MYYNTTNEEGEDLRESWTKTATQDELILALFKENPNQSFTPNEIQHLCDTCDRNWPITSIRRTINTLTKSGNLTKTDTKLSSDALSKAVICPCGIIIPSFEIVFPDENEDNSLKPVYSVK